MAISKHFTVILSADHFNRVVSINHNLPDGNYYLGWKQQVGIEHNIADRVPTCERVLEIAHVNPYFKARAYSSMRPAKANW